MAVIFPHANKYNMYDYSHFPHMYVSSVIFIVVLHIHVFLAADTEGPSVPPAKKAKVSTKDPLYTLCTLYIYSSICICGCIK